MNKDEAIQAVAKEVWTTERLSEISNGALPHGLTLLPAAWNGGGLGLGARRSDDAWEWRHVPATEIPDGMRGVIDKLDQEIVALCDRAQEFNPPEPSPEDDA